MNDPYEQIGVYVEVMGLIDAACAKLQPIIGDEANLESDRGYLMGVWRTLSFEREAIAEIARTTALNAGVRP